MRKHYTLRLFISRHSLPSEQADANTALLAQMRMLARCAGLLFPHCLVREQASLLNESEVCTQTHCTCMHPCNADQNPGKLPVERSCV